jgi:hypothetical protein
MVFERFLRMALLAAVNGGIRVLPAQQGRDLSAVGKERTEMVDYLWLTEHLLYKLTANLILQF